MDKETGALAFVKAFDRLTAGYPILAGIADEAHFSWRACDTCGCELGGDRYFAKLVKPGRDENGKLCASVDVSSCVDCVVYATNGDLPENWKVR